jgi:hypothetical protein
MVRLLCSLAIVALVAACSRETSSDRQADRTSEAQDCITEWAGPWTAECSAEWVADVVDRAGYRVSGHTQSAWIVTGRGRSFYIWATDEGPPVEQILRREPYRLVAEVAGEELYDDGTRTFWKANGFLFWIEAGPRGDSVAPTPTELAPLIRSSRLSTPPP